jgi:toxin ParE1/3/4
MRLNVELDVSARNDLVEIWEYISENSVSDTVADRFVARIKASCDKVGNAPNGGRARDDIFPGLRMVPFEHSAVILYVVETERVLIKNIFYGGRDYEALMRQKP